MSRSGIYKIENIDTGTVYIGQSDDIDRRLKAHKASLKSGTHHNTYLQNSYNKHGERAFEYSIIEECDVADLDEREMFWIAEYDSFYSGYNMTTGGGGTRGYIASEETRRKLSEHHPDWHGEKNPMYGKNIKDYMTQEAYDAWLLSHKKPHHNRRGVPISDEQKRRHSIAMKEYYKTHDNPRFGVRLDDEQKQKLSNSLKIAHMENPYMSVKSVVCLNTGDIFKSCKDAAAATGAHPLMIGQSCRANIYSSGVGKNGEALVWRFSVDYCRMTEEEIRYAISEASYRQTAGASVQKKRVRCINTGEIFESATAASQHYQLDHSSLCKVCRGKNKTCGKLPTGEKLRWEYIE